MLKIQYFATHVNVYMQELKYPGTNEIYS